MKKNPSRHIRRILDVIVALLCLRMALQLLGANTVSWFYRFVESISDPLVYPFTGLFSPWRVTASATIDWAIPAAIAAYALVAYVLTLIIDSFGPAAAAGAPLYNSEDDELHE